MATGSPVSFWYGTRAQFDSITTKLDTTLYFITDEQALYKGTVKFSGSGVDTLLTISATEPTASSVTTGDKYFNTTDNLIHVLLNDNGTVSTTATYEPANGALYYNADAQRFQTLIKDGSSYVPTEIYDAGISVEDGTGLVLNGTTVGGLDATTNSKGVVKIGANISVSNGVISVPVATNAVFGVVKSGDNITNTNGVFSVAKATASSLGVVKPGDNINVDNNGQISVPVANGNTKGVVKVSTNIDVADGVISVKDASTSDKGVVQLVNDPSSEDMRSMTKAITPWVVKFMYDDLYTGKQDNISCETPINLDVNRISLAYGDGLTVGVTGTTNANKLITNEATVEETLTDSRKVIIDGSTETTTINNITDRVVEPHDLKGALSVGQAVDVSCPFNRMELTTDMTAENFLSTFTIATGASGKHFGFNPFQKFASGLKYLLRFDITNNDDTSWSLGTQRFSKDILNINPVGAGETKRFAAIFNEAYPDFYTNSSSASMHATISKFRVYEVTALTDEAIAYIAQLPDPDAFFRSNTVDTVKNKYLVKNDMVCPWIKTISMPDNSDLTVASGLAYKIKYTNDNTHTITADTIPADAYGQDAHIKMFIKGTSAIHFTEPLVLMNALTPNAGHNLSVKFRDGQAFVYVDDTDAGYVVTVASGNTNGTLNYAITGGTTDYTIFSADLDGTTVDAGDAIFVGGGTITTMNILGNGTEDTVITGNISATSGKTINFQSLTIDGGTLGGAGVMAMADVSFAGNVWSDVYSNNLKIYGATTIDGTLNVSTLVLQNGAVLQGGTFITRNPLALQYGTFKDMLVTGSTWTATNVGHYGGGVWENCEITGNTSTGDNGALFCTGYPVTFTNCYIHDNVLRTNYTGLFGHNVTINGGTVGYISMMTTTLDALGKPTYTATVSGNVVGNVIKAYDSNIRHFNLHIISGATLTGRYSTNDADPNVISVGELVNDVWVEGGSFSYTMPNNVVATVSACRFNQLNPGNTSYKLTSGASSISLVAMSTWSAENAIFGSPLDASDVDTVKLSGTTFTDIAKTLNANRIQLPAATTVSFQGNTNDADTKILDAGLIVVGDNPASPFGSATVVNASGTSSTVSGIGTYIDKEGDNDFVANNTTNVKAVDASTTGAKYLGTVLSATTGGTGADRFAKIDSGATAVVNEAVNAVNKQIITHDYEPIIGGTFSLTSATVDEATKTVAIQSGGTMSIVDIRGGKDSVIDLGGARLLISSGTTASVSGCTLSGGYGSNGGGALYSIAGDMSAYGCTFGGNSATSGGCVYLNSAGGYFSGCTFAGNQAVISGGVVFTRGNKECVFVDCTISGNTAGAYGGAIFAQNSCTVSRSFVNGNAGTNGIQIFCAGGTVVLNGSTVGACGMNGGAFVFDGSNTIDELTGAGSVIVSSGAILDLTGNTNATPIAPRGGITFEGANQIIYGTTENPTTAYIDGCTAATIASGGVVSTTAVISPASGVNWSAANVDFRPVTSRICNPNSGATVTLTNCICNPGTSDTMRVTINQTVVISGGTINGTCHFSTNGGNYVLSGNINAACYFVNEYGNSVPSSATITIKTGTVLDCTSVPNNYVIFFGADSTGGIIVEGNITVKPYGGGDDVTIVGGTYSRINRNGTTVPAQA